MTGEPESNEERLYQLLEARYRALGTRSPRCSAPGCAESDPLVLTGVEPDILCHEHRLEQQGRDWVEDHHPAGRRNDPATVSLPANEHSAITAHQGLWDRDTLRNPDGSPLLQIAAWIQGWVEVMRVMIDRSIGRIPAELERLDALLVEVLGADWWEVLGWSW